MVRKETKGVEKLLKEFEVKKEEITKKDKKEDIAKKDKKEEAKKEKVDKKKDKSEMEIPLLGPEEVEEIEERIRGRPKLSREEKLKRKKERKEKKRRELPLGMRMKTPYVGGRPDLNDSGGWCLTESKTVTTIVDRRTGIKSIKINGLEVERR